MKFVQYKEDVIWKEGRMCLRGRPVVVDDEYALGVFSSDPKFEKFEPKENHEEEGQRTDTSEILKEASIPLGLKGKECSKCHKLIPRGWYMHQKWCRG